VGKRAADRRAVEKEEKGRGREAGREEELGGLKIARGERGRQTERKEG
jgi:hypothetical protein